MEWVRNVFLLCRVATLTRWRCWEIFLSSVVPLLIPDPLFYTQSSIIIGQKTKKIEDCAMWGIPVSPGGVCCGISSFFCCQSVQGPIRFLHTHFYTNIKQKTERGLKMFHGGFHSHQVAVLEVLQRPRGRQVPPAAAQLCVANTHLYSNPELPDVKLWQCNALLQELEGFIHSRQLPLLVRFMYHTYLRFSYWLADCLASSSHEIVILLWACWRWDCF